MQAASVTPVVEPGGIDFNSANLNLQIKRDGRGVPLPISQQNLKISTLMVLSQLLLKLNPQWTRLFYLNFKAYRYKHGC